MTIPRRILLQVAIGAGLVIAVVTAVTYGLVYQGATQRDLQHLDTYVRERARREEIGFKQVEENLLLVRGQFLKRMEAPVSTEELARWNDRFGLFPDGSWRSHGKFSDGRRFASLWARNDAEFTSELRTAVLRAQDLCDELLPGWADAFPSVYFVLPAPPGWLNIGFDPRIPNWVWDTPAGYDASELEWFHIAMPDGQPKDGFGWTGVIEEPTTKVPIVSVYLPIFKEGRFLGSIGHDKYVDRLMAETTRSDLPGARHLIFRGDGRIIAHPTKLKEILASKGQLRMQTSGEPDLASLFRAVSQRTENRFLGYDEESGLYYSVGRLAGPDWFFLTTMSREQLQRQAFESAQWVLWSGLISLALVLAFLAETLRRQIAQPLLELTRATRQMSSGDVSARAIVARTDEFGALAGAFNEMAGRVAQRDAELQAEKASLERRVAERTAELQESEARFIAAFRHSPSMQSLVRAADRVLVEVNETFLAKFGFSRDQVIGRTASELGFWLDPQELIDFSGELERDGYVVGREIRLRGADGRILTVLISSMPVEIGGVPHLLSAGVDITSRKEAEAKLLESQRQLRESEARFSMAFQTSPVLMTIARLEDGRLVEVNPAFMKHIGLDRAEIIGRDSRELGLWVDPNARARFFKELNEHRVVRNVECQIRTGRGTIHTMLLSGEVMEINREPHLVTFGLDITQTKLAEAELQNALTRERELNHLKSDFVSLVSHEFRTPLEVIMSSVDNLDRYHDRLPQEKRQGLLHTIHRSVRRMANMMEEVLVLGRVEARKIEFRPEPFDLGAFCRRASDEIQSATDTRCRIAVKVAEGLPFVIGDENLLRHILSNLLSNAVKYSPPGSPVELLVDHLGKDAVFQVVDHGCGIPESDQKRLFQAFQRGSNVRHIPGTGLGLLIVQRCVALHEGELRFTSAEGRGTVFTVVLPLFSHRLDSTPEL